MQGQVTSNPTARASRRPAYWLAVLGGVAGLVTWAYDFEFFLNAGGPETPISDAILRATGTEHGDPLVIVFWPAAVLVLIGMCGGLLVGWVFAMSRRQSAK